MHICPICASAAIAALVALVGAIRRWFVGCEACKTGEHTEEKHEHDEVGR